MKKFLLLLSVIFVSAFTQAQINASFTTSKTDVCQGEEVLLINTTPAPTTSQKWLINGSEFSTTEDANYTFNNAGTYTISLIAYNNAESDTAMKVVTVHNMPNVNIESNLNGLLCAGIETKLTANILNDNDLAKYSYNWAGKVWNGNETIDNFDFGNGSETNAFIPPFNMGGTIVNNTTYTVVVFNPVCMAIATQTISTAPNPIITNIEDNSMLCDFNQERNINLIPSPLSNNYTYSWIRNDNNDNNSISNTNKITIQNLTTNGIDVSSYTYTFTITSAVGCIGAIPYISVIKVLPNAKLEVGVVNEEPICKGEQVTITAQSNFTDIEWSTGEIGNQIIVLPSNIGDNYYNVHSIHIYADYNKVCSTIGFVTISVEDCSPTNEDFQFYPNPSKDFIYVKDIDQLEMVEIYNKEGQLVYKSSIITDKIDISSFSGGIYYARLNYPDKKLTRKFVKI